MSIEAFEAVFSYSEAEGGDRLVLLVLADHCNPDNHNTCWPGQKLIAKKAKCSERTVRRHLKSLEELGEITPVGRRNGKGAVIYRLACVESYKRVKAAGEEAISDKRPGAIKPDGAVRSSEVSLDKSGDTGRTNQVLQPGQRCPIEPLENHKGTVSTFARSDFDQVIADLHAALCDALSIDPTYTGRGLGDLLPIADWLDKEPERADQIEKIVKLRIRQKLAGDRDWLPSTWGYFSKAVEEGLKTQARRNAETADDFDPMLQAEYQNRARLKLLYTKGTWREESWGPRPGASGCCVPPDLIAEFEERYGGGSKS